MKNQFFLILFFLCCFVNSSFAERFNKCIQTPEVIHDSVPDVFLSSNDLHVDQTSLFAARGKKIYVSGRITDENCVPVSGALVSIWHANAFGSYQFKQSSKNEISKKDNKKSSKEYSDDLANSKKPNNVKNRLQLPGEKEQDIQQASYDPYFVGTGVSVTDNTGYYAFITILPGKIPDTSERVINFLITHNDFSPLETSMYFNSDVEKRETLFPNYIKNDSYNFDIVLKGKNSYLKY